MITCKSIAGFITEKPPLLSIVIPIFNESKCIGTVNEELLDVLCETSLEILYVDDGSMDGSPEVLKDIQSKYPDKVSVIFLYGRNGKASAQQIGIKYAKGEFIVFMDGDGQDDPNDIHGLLAKLKTESAHLVVGRRRKRCSPWYYRVMSVIFNAVMSLISGLDIKDSNASLKIVRRKVLNNIPIYAGHYRFLPFLLNASGFEVTERDVNHRHRIDGVSKYGIGKVMDGMWDMLTVLFLTRSYLNPLHFFGGIGFLLGIPGFAICVYITWLHFEHGHILNRYPLLLLGILLILAGIQLICTGLLGEMLTYSKSRLNDTPFIRSVLQPSSAHKAIEHIDSNTLD